MVGYSLWLWFVKVGEGGGAGLEEEGQAALVVDLDCFLQVRVATSLWSFVEMIQAKPGPRVGHVTCGGDTFRRLLNKAPAAIVTSQ